MRFARAALACLTGLLLGAGCSLLLDSNDAPCDGGVDCSGAQASGANAAAMVDADLACPQSCPPGSVCDPSDGSCAECTLDQHCAPRICDSVARRCIDCRDSADCAQVDGRQHCNLETTRCVQCLRDSDCPSGELCSSSHSCVGCMENVDCLNELRPRCDALSASCSPCKSDSDCAHIDGLPFCAPEGRCVECTLETEAVCGGMVCNHRDYRCTNLMRGVRQPCDPCSFDSECLSGDRPASERDHRCVPTRFKGEPRGAHCFAIAGRACERPYTVVSEPMVSTSGAPAASYCAIDQLRTTCEAVREQHQQECNVRGDAQCGAHDLIDDAACLTIVRFNGLRCTYACSADDQCPEDSECAQDMYCQ